MQGTRAELKKIFDGPLVQGFNYLALNKPGMGAKKKNAAVFEKSFRQPLRLGDYKKAIEAIIPSDHRVVLVGYSEGAYLAPCLARELSNVMGVAIIGGGTRGWIKEELNNAKRENRRSDMIAIRKILKTPQSAKKWNGFSHATWYSYRKDTTFLALQELSIPVLAIIGAQDRIIDFKTTKADLKTLVRSKNIDPKGRQSVDPKGRQSIDLQIISDCGHEFTNHWLLVSQKLTRFVGYLLRSSFNPKNVQDL